MLVIVGDVGHQGTHIEVVELELSKALIQSLLNNGGVVLGVPQLGGLRGLV